MDASFPIPTALVQNMAGNFVASRDRFSAASQNFPSSLTSPDWANLNFATSGMDCTHTLATLLITYEKELGLFVQVGDPQQGSSASTFNLHPRLSFTIGMEEPLWFTLLERLHLCSVSCYSLCSQATSHVRDQDVSGACTELCLTA